LNDEIEGRRLRPVEEIERERGRQDDNRRNRVAIEEDQNGVFWSLLGDLYTVRSSL
jgi:hypothetical protein